MNSPINVYQPKTSNFRLYSNISQTLLLYKTWEYYKNDYEILGVYYLYVKIPQCGYMEHGLKDIAFYVLNKANLRDLIAATVLVISLKLDSNRRFFSPCDLEIWLMTPIKNRAPLLCYFKLFAAFRSHWWIQTGVRVRKRLIWVKIDDFLAVWPWNLTDDLQKQ